MQPHIIEEIWEDIERRKAELIGRRLRVTIKPEKAAGNRRSVKAVQETLPSALGKYAFVSGGSEEFALENQAEIEREDRTDA